MAAKERTTTYRWPDDALIRRIDVREQSDGRAVAYLYADESDAAQLDRQELRAALRLKGWGTLSDYREGRFALRVSGLKNSAELLVTLRQLGAIQQEPIIEEDTLNTEKAMTWPERIRTHSLQASGIIYSIGNAVYFINGLLRNKELKERGGKPKTGQIGSALVWGAGDALVATIGKQDDSRQLASLLVKLERHYQSNGIEIPGTAALRVETSRYNQTTGTRIYDFLHEHVNQIKCASEVLAAVQYHKAGAEQNNIWKQRTAITFGLGFLASLLIPEKKIDPEKYAEAGTIHRLWMKIQSNPLSIGGISGYSNTIFTTVGARKEQSKFRDMQVNPGNYSHLPPDKLPSKYYSMDYLAPGVMFFGNSLYATSKKNGINIKTADMVDDVIIVAAQILNKQPENVREAAIESTAKFLGERPEIKDTRSEIVQKLRAQMEVQRKSPWFEKTPLPAYTPQPKKPKFAVPATANPASDGMVVSTSAANEETSQVPATTPLVHVQAQSAQHEGQAANEALATIRA